MKGALLLGFSLLAWISFPAATVLADCTPPPAGLVGWWPGEGNANDIIGGDDGTLSPTGATYAPGEVGLGFRFDGTNGFVQIPDSAALKPTNVTVEAWVWLDPSVPPNQGGEQIVFKKNTWSAWFEGYSLLKIPIDNGDGTVSDRFQFCISRDGDQVAINSQTIAQRGVWYHVAGTYDGTTSKLYVNGVMEASAVAGFALDYDTTPIYIGTTGTWVPYLNMFAGIIDEVSIYNRALATDEIQAIYNAGNAGKCNAPYIAIQPAGQTAVAGSEVDLSVSMGGSGPFSYQWLFNGSSIAGATNATLVLTNLHTNQSGTYSVIITTPDGTLTSSDAVVTVTAQNQLIYDFSGRLFFVPAATNGMFVGWANIHGRKQYWVSPFSGYLWITVPGKANHTFTVLGQAGDGVDASGLPCVWAYLHQGQNTLLTIGRRQKFSFPETLTSDSTHVYPDPQTGIMILCQAASTYAFVSAATQTANNTGQTTTDLVNATITSLQRQGYQQQ